MKSRTLSRALVALTVSAGLVFCLTERTEAALPPKDGGSPNAAVAQLVLDAQKAIKAGKLPLAVIDFKNAVGLDPHNGKVRAQLGIVLLQTGSYYDAERELRQARRDGADDRLVLPSLFSTMISRNEEKQLLTEFPGPNSSSDLTPVILYARAWALLNLGQLADATTEIEKSLKLRRDVPSLLLRARIAQRIGDHRTALQFADEAISLSPNRLDSSLVKIGLLVDANDPNAALALADQLVSKFPSSFSAQFARIEVLMRLKRDDKARAAVDAALVKNPGMPMGIYYRALLLARAGNVKDAWRVAQVLPKEFVELQPGIAVSLSEMAAKSGHLDTAAAILNGAVGRFPQNVELRTQLASMRMRQNDVGGAISALEAVREKVNPAAAQTLASLYVKGGRTSEAQELLEKLIQSGQGTDAAVLQLVALKRQSGQADQALKDLIAAVDRKPTDPVLANPLVVALISQRRFEDALSVADKLGGDPRQRLTSLLLRGQVLAVEHKLDDSLASYTKAMQVDPASQPALYGHAIVLESMQRYADATKDLRAILALNPRNMGAYLKLAEIAARQNQDGQVRAILMQAIKASPQDPAPRLALARYLGSRGDRAGALNAANDLLKVQPRSAQGLAILSTLQLSMGKKAEAVAAARRLVGLDPRAPDAQILLGNALYANGDRTGANGALKNAVQLASNSPQVRLAQINLLFAEKDSQGAIAAAQAYQASNPGPQADLLLGDTLGRAGRRDQAMAVYKKSFAANPNSAVVLRIAAISAAAGDSKSAVQILSNWISKNPDDTATRSQYATLLLQQGNDGDAIREFREVLKRKPDDAVSLNNLAWLRRDQDPAEAVSLASRAVALAPDSSEMLDTLGWIKLKHGRAADSVPLFKRAHELRPRDGEISYHLVLSLEAAGSHDAAKGLLKALLASKVQFADLPEANRLALTWH